MAQIKQCASGSKAQQTTSGNEPPLGSRGLDANRTFPSPVSAELLHVRLRDPEHSDLLQSTVAQPLFFVTLSWIKYLSLAKLSFLTLCCSLSSGSKKCLVSTISVPKQPCKCLWQYPVGAGEEEVMMGELQAEGCRQGGGSLSNHPSVTARWEDGLILVPVVDPIEVTLTLPTGFSFGNIQAVDTPTLSLSGFM